jgi:uncharacterized protein (TIGR03118 family)
MRSLFGKWLRTPKRTRPRRIVPRLETLEDRTVPSTLTVTSAADDGSAGTLRALIAAANSDDTINFDPSLDGQTITLTSGELAVAKSLDIEGPGAALLTISGNKASRVFDISGSSTSVKIAGLTLADGLASATTATGPSGNITMGGAILNTGAHVTLSGVSMVDNQASGTQVGYVQTNLVSDIPGLAQLIDPSLKNPWGTSFAADGSFSISDQKTSVSTLYSVTAAGVSPESPTVAIPTTAAGPQGPTGQVSNATSSFLVNGTPASFIYANLNGTISAWNSSLGTTAQVEATTTGTCTGLDLESTGSGDFLYAATGKGINVFDGSFNRLTLPTGAFVDPQLPAGLVPFSIDDINGDLYVMYAPAGPPSAKNSAPLGSGAIAVFDTSGNFLKQLTAGGNLASPWGIVLAPSTFGEFGGDLLVGNFSYAAPEINAFDPSSGAYLGTLSDASGNTLLSGAQGIWDMTFGNGGSGGNPNTLYFATGLNAENDGLFGAIDALPNIAQGGAVANVSGGVLTVTCSTFADNQAVGGLGGNALGGAIDNAPGAALTICYSVFGHNQAVGGDGDATHQAGTGLGGALENLGAKATVGQSWFTGNEAIGGDNTAGGLAGRGEGGGMFNDTLATLDVTESTLTDNLVRGGQRSKNAFDNGFAEGGGIGNRGALTVSYSTFAQNQAVGGAGSSSGITGGNGIGGGLMSNGSASAPASASIDYSTFWDNLAEGGTGGAAATGGSGAGGGIFTDTGALLLSHSILRENQALGGAGGSGGRGRGGALAAGSQNGNTFVAVSESMLAANQAVGGAAAAGGAAGIGSGGGISNQVNIPGHTADLSVERCVLLGNQALGGAGDAGGTGRGGGIENAAGANLTVSDSALILNQAVGGHALGGGNGGNGLGGGGFNDAASSVTFQSSIIISNEATGGTGGLGGSDGQGVGGGLYLTPGGTACADLWTAIFGNYASTSNDDVFGTLGKC